MAYKTERLELRLSPAEAAALDKVRGSSSRSAWIRNQIIRAANPVEHVIVEETSEIPLVTKRNPVVPTQAPPDVF